MSWFAAYILSRTKSDKQPLLFMLESLRDNLYNWYLDEANCICIGIHEMCACAYSLNISIFLHLALMGFGVHLRAEGNSIINTTQYT